MTPNHDSAATATLDVALGNRSYPITIGTNLLHQPPSALRQYWQTVLARRQTAIITNVTVAPLYRETVLEFLKSLDVAPPLVIELPDGEHTKSLATIEHIVGELLNARFERGGALIALGGGVVGDITGFAAAVYQRGIEFLQIPTTLLAQVDSSVGGKTGVNHPTGKNMIGAFHQPRAVLIDITTLTTLPEREVRAGIAEIIKYGLVFDHDFFAWLEQNIDALLALEPDVTRTAIQLSCAAKAAVVAADEREGGQRALLNLGHSFGHAIEAQMGYGDWLHGEAVGTGMAMAARLSRRLGWLDDAATARVERLIERAGLALTPPATMSADDFRRHMAVDKKNANGQLRLVLLRGIGRGVVTADFDIDALDTELVSSLQ
ncbi:MAG: 3-dehydroquinate synthase [Thioalkalivibrionaceae bacterium]